MAAPAPASLDASESALFNIYQEIVETQFGSHDAYIFQKIREWCFSNGAIPPHDFAGITIFELHDWQLRHGINLEARDMRVGKREPLFG